MQKTAPIFQEEDPDLPANQKMEEDLSTLERSLLGDPKNQEIAEQVLQHYRRTARPRLEILDLLLQEHGLALRSLVPTILELHRLPGSGAEHLSEWIAYGYDSQSDEAAAGQRLLEIVRSSFRTLPYLMACLGDPCYPEDLVKVADLESSLGNLMWTLRKMGPAAHVAVPNILYAFREGSPPGDFDESHQIPPTLEKLACPELEVLALNGFPW